LKLLEFLKKYEEIKNNDKDIIASYVVKIISGTDEVRITHMLDSAYVLSLRRKVSWVLVLLYIYIKTKYPKAYEDYKRHHTLYGLNLCGGDPEVLMEIFEFAFRVVDASLYIKD